MDKHDFDELRGHHNWTHTVTCNSRRAEAERQHHKGETRGQENMKEKPSENTRNTQIIEKIILFNNDYKWLKHFIKEKKSQVVLLQIIWHNHTYQIHTCALIKKVIPERLQGRYEERKPSSRTEYSVKWTPSFAHMTAMSVKTGYIIVIPCQWIVIPLW